MRFRRGFSLIELLIVLTVSTAMLMIAVSVLYLLKETQDNVRVRFEAGRRMARLANQFRDDVHWANHLERETAGAAPVGAAVWKFTLAPDTVVLYEISPGTVRRSQAGRGGKIQDDYRLPAGMVAVITEPGAGSDVAMLRLEAPEMSAGRARPVQVEALLGFANRHASQADRSGE